MNYLSLFSGVGGIDLGLDRAGWTCVGQVELDPFCRRVLEKHWPEVPRHDDVRTAAGWWLGTTRPAVDLVCGGFPCQPFSTAGRRQGVTDERWGWPWFWDVVRALRPRYVLVENVAALLRDADAFGWLLGDLAASGYDADWDCVPAAAVGAPHRRDRLFLVAHARGERRREGPGELGGLGPTELRAAVADADQERRRGRSRLFRPVGWAEPANGGGHVADAQSAERRAPQPQGLATTGGAPEPRERRGCGGPGSDRRGAQSDLGGSPHGISAWLDGSWEHGISRTAHGVPNRTDRLRAVGNAVVPQVAEHVGRLILTHAQAVVS